MKPLFDCFHLGVSGRGRAGGSLSQGPNQCQARPCKTDVKKLALASKSGDHFTDLQVYQKVSRPQSLQLKAAQLTIVPSLKGGEVPVAPAQRFTDVSTRTANVNNLPRSNIVVIASQVSKPYARCLIDMVIRTRCQYKLCGTSHHLLMCPRGFMA